MADASAKAINQIADRVAADIVPRVMRRAAGDGIVLWSRPFYVVLAREVARAIRERMHQRGFSRDEIERALGGMAYGLSRDLAAHGYEPAARVEWDANYFPTAPEVPHAR